MKKTIVFLTVTGMILLGGTTVLANEEPHYSDWGDYITNVSEEELNEYSNMTPEEQLEFETSLNKQSFQNNNPLPSEVYDPTIDGKSDLTPDQQKEVLDEYTQQSESTSEVVENVETTENSQVYITPESDSNVQQPTKTSENASEYARNDVENVENQEIVYYDGGELPKTGEVKPNMVLRIIGFGLVGFVISTTLNKIIKGWKD